MPSLIAMTAGRDDVVTSILTAITTGMQMLCSGLEAMCLGQGQPKSVGKGLRIRLPHGKSAVEAEACLSLESRMTEFCESASHGEFLKFQETHPAVTGEMGTGRERGPARTREAPLQRANRIYRDSITRAIGNLLLSIELKPVAQPRA